MCLCRHVHCAHGINTGSCVVALDSCEAMQLEMCKLNWVSMQRMAGIWEQEVDSFLLTSFLWQISFLWQPQDLLKKMMNGGPCRQQQMAAWTSLPFSKKLFLALMHAKVLLNQTVRLVLNIVNDALHAK